MKVFDCNRCGYSTRFKKDLKQHLLKKIPCISKTPNAPSPEELIIQLYPLQQTKTFICKCGKKYSYSSGLSKHKKECVKHKEEEFLEIVKDIKKDLATLKQKDNNNIITNNTINNTMNNMIVVKDFGDEDLSHLSPKFIENCLGVMSMGMKELTKVIHLNINKPENHNIKVTNIKSPYVSVIKDGKWIYKEKDEVLSDLIWKENQILKNHYEDNETDIKRKWTEQKLEYVKRWLDNMDDENPELWSRLKKEIFLILVNNRDIIMDKMSS